MSKNNNNARIESLRSFVAKHLNKANKDAVLFADPSKRRAIVKHHPNLNVDLFDIEDKEPETRKPKKKLLKRKH